MSQLTDSVKKIIVTNVRKNSPIYMNNGEEIKDLNFNNYLERKKIRCFTSKIYQKCVNIHSCRIGDNIGFNAFCGDLRLIKNILLNGENKRYKRREHIIQMTRIKLLNGENKLLKCLRTIRRRDQFGANRRLLRSKSMMIPGRPDDYDRANRQLLSSNRMIIIDHLQNKRRDGETRFCEEFGDNLCLTNARNTRRSRDD